MPPTDLQSRIGDKVHRNSNGTYRNRVWVRNQNERQQEPPISSRPSPYRKRDYSPPYRGVKSEPREPENLWDSPSEDKWESSRRDPPALLSRLSSHSSAGEKFTKRKSSLIDRIGDRSSRPSSWDVQDTRSDISEMGSNDIVGRGTYSKHLYDSPQQYNENFSANRATQFVEPKTAIPVHNSAHKSTSGPPIADSASTWLNNFNLPPSSASLERCKELLSSLVDLNLQRRKGTKGVNPAPKQSKGGESVLTEDVCLSFLSHSKSIHSEMEHTPSGLQPSGYHVVDNHISINQQNGEPHSPFDMKYQNHFRVPHAVAPIASIAPRFHEKSNAEQGQNRRYSFDRASPLSRNSRDNSRGHADAALPTPPASASHSSPSREPPKAPRAMMSDTFHSSPPSGRVSRLSSSSKDPSNTGNRDSNGITGIAQMKPVTPSPSTTYKPLSVESGPIPIPWPASYTSPTTSSGTAIPIPLDLTFLQQDKRDKEPSRMDPRESSPVRPMVSPRRRNSSPRRRNTSPSPKSSSPTEFSRPSYPRRVSRSPSPRLPPKPVLRRSTWDTSPNYHRRSVSPMRPRSPRPLILSSRSANLLKRERSIERHEAPRRSNGSPPRRDAGGPGAYGSTDHRARGRTPPPPKKRRNYSPSPPPSATSHRPLQKERGPSNRYGTQEKATRNYTYAGLKRGFLSGPSGWKSFSDLNGSRRERDAGSESQRRPHSRERNTQLLPNNTAPQAVNVHPAVRVKMEEEPIRLGMDVDVIDVDAAKEIGEKGDESLDDDRELYGSPRYPDQPLDLDQGDRDQQDSVLECEKLPSPPALLPNQSQPKPPKVSPTPVLPAPPVTTDAGSTDAGRIHDGIRNVHAEDSITNEGNDNVHNPLSNTHKDSPIQESAASMERGTASPRHTPGPFSALEAKTQLELDPPRNDGLRDASAHDNAPELAGDHRDRDVDLPQEEVQIGQRDALLWQPSLQIPPQHPNDHQQDDPEERSPAIENMRVDLDREQYQRQQNVVVQSHNASGQTMLAVDINSLITDLNSGPVQCNNVPGRWFTVSGSNHMNVVDVPFMVDNSIASEWSFAGNMYINPQKNAKKGLEFNLMTPASSSPLVASVHSPKPPSGHSIQLSNTSKPGTPVPSTNSIHITLHSLRVSSVIRQLSTSMNSRLRHAPLDEVELVNKLMSLPNEWPVCGRLIVEIYHDTEQERDESSMDVEPGQIMGPPPVAYSMKSVKTWLPRHLTKATPPLSLSQYLQRGPNRIRLIQMGDLANWMFVLIAHNKPLSAFQSSRAKSSPISMDPNHGRSPSLRIPLPVSSLGSDAMDVDADTSMSGQVSSGKERQAPQQIERAGSEEGEITTSSSDEEGHSDGSVEHSESVDDSEYEVQIPRVLQVAFQKLNFDKPYHHQSLNGEYAFPINPAVWDSFGGADDPDDGNMVI